MLLNIFYISVAVFALGFCIFIHELGHFLAAKKRGLVADRFSIGFGPRLFGWDWKGTDFRVSLIPLGGYVSLPQLVDMGRLEGGEDEDEASKLPPIGYADKMIVAVMGAVFNLLFALVLSLVLWGVGREIVKTTQIDYVAEEIINSEGERVPGPAYEAGIQAGDTILRVDGQRVGDWMQLNNAIMTGTGRAENGRAKATVEILRDEETLELTVHPELITTEKFRSLGVDPGVDLVVQAVQKNMPAFEAGLEAGDVLLKLDGQEIESSAFLSIYLSNHEGGPIDLTVLRDGEERTLAIEPRVASGESTPRFGFVYSYQAEKERVHYNPIEQLYIFANTMRMTLKALVHVDSDVGLNDMSGPVGIVHGLTSMARYGPIDLIWFLALINVNLAILNLLPLPIFDGGHMLFATIAKISGRALPVPVMEKIYGVTIVLLLSMVVYITFFDVSRVGRAIGLLDDEPVAVEDQEPNAADKAP